MAAVIVALHGMETHGKWFAPLALDLNKKGVGVLAMDRRGSGLNAGIGGIGQMALNENYDLWLNDISASVGEASNLGVSVYVLGNSWAGNPVLAWSQGDHAQLARGAILLTPGLVARKPNVIQKIEILFRQILDCLALA